MWLSAKASGAAKACGRAILVAAPLLMKFLSIAGTAAMFLVGGGILVHGVAPLHHMIEAWMQSSGAIGWLVEMIANGVIGIVAGGLVLAVVTVTGKIFGKKA